MIHWQLNYDILLVFQTNHGSFKFLKGNISCDLKILKRCNISRYLVLPFLCLFELVYCTWLSLAEMAGILASECCSAAGRSRIPQLQETTTKSNNWKASTVVFLSCTGNQQTHRSLQELECVLGARQPPTAAGHAPLCFPLWNMWNMEVQRELTG